MVPLAGINTLACATLAAHGWWWAKNGGQKYVDILQRRREFSTKREQAVVEKARADLFNAICKMCAVMLLGTSLALLLMVNLGSRMELQTVLAISMYAAGALVTAELVPTPSCDAIALGGHVFLLLSMLCPGTDTSFVKLDTGRFFLRAFLGLLLPDLRKLLWTNLVVSSASIWKLCHISQALEGGHGHHFLGVTCSELLSVLQVVILHVLVQRLVEDLASSRLGALEISGKSHARRNLLSVLVDADIILDSNLRICAPSNKVEHFFAADLGQERTTVEGVKLHHLVAEADRSKLREFLNRAGMNMNEPAEAISESSRSVQGGSPASSISIQMGESRRLVQIFHASIPADGSDPKQPQHLVGVQEQFSAHEFSEREEPQVFMDQAIDAEQMYLSTQNLAAQQQSYEGRQRRPPSTGSRGSVDSKGSASSASSLRSSVAGLPEVASMSFIFDGYSEGLNIVEATLRFDTFDDKKGDPGRVPQMRHWIRSRHWDKFRDWVQTETQRCCAGQVEQVKAFEGPLEFYYPGQQDMTLVSGSVSVMGIQNATDDDGEDEDEDPKISQAPRGATSSSVERSSASTDSMGCNASADREDAKIEVYEAEENPLVDGDPAAEVDALLVEVECKAFSQYRSLAKPRKSKRYGHLQRNRPLEPSLVAIPESQ